MDDINCSNCMIMDFKESLCDNCEAMKRRGRAEELEKLIINMPRWIPCAERLPGVDEEVLATTAWGDITIAWRIGIDKWFIHEGNTNATTPDLVAWMPLPEPWEGEQDG